MPGRNALSHYIKCSLQGHGCSGIFIVLLNFIWQDDFSAEFSVLKNTQMPTIQSLTNILNQLSEQNTEKIKLAVVDIDGILRGKVISFEKFKSIAEKGFGFCDVVFGWVANDAAYDNAKITGWNTGNPDAM